MVLSEQEHYCERNYLIIDNVPNKRMVLGRVTEVIKDKHGLVCVANVKISTAELRCPVNQLSLVLEADCDQPNVETVTELSTV